VALAENEAVTPFGEGVARVDGQDRSVERGQDVGNREVAPDVTEFRPPDHRQIRQSYLSGQLTYRSNRVGGVAGMSVPGGDELRGSCRVNG
jgi:hypothetical protein